MQIRCLIASLSASLLLALPAAARDNHALLIGASSYPSLDQKDWLKGPANDVALVAAYLTTASPVRFDPANITVLADGAPGDTPATLAAIRAAFAGLTDRVEPGDFVYLHFSGHGSQAPARDPGAELDGLDELFLPVDIGPWRNGTDAVENALVDDEIATMIGDLRARGADVWAVFDSCHSGTVTRGAPADADGERQRQLTPDALGIPESAMDAAGETARGLPQPEDPRVRPESAVETNVYASAMGSYVGFFAAQTNETTPEKNLPAGDPDRKPQGVFTYTLFQTLAEYPSLTYRQLGQEVLRRYAVKNLARATPMFEGDLDAVVFDGTPGERVAQWPLDSANPQTLAAGTLQGLATGSLLAVLANAADPTDKAIGYAKVGAAQTFSADLIPVAHAGLAALTLADLPKGAYLRKISADLDFTLSVALPDGDSAAALAMRTVADSLLADGSLGPRLSFVAAGEDADLRLAILPDSPRPQAIWFLPASGLIAADAYATTPSVETTGKSPQELALVVADTLTRLARIRNLLRVGEGMGGAMPDVSVTLQTRSAEQPRLVPLDPAGVPRLIPGDEVHVQATNNSAKPVDLNVLYIGSDFSISHMFAGRLQPGDTLNQGLLRITDAGFGRDRVVLVLSPAVPKSAIEDLSFLAQDALEILRDAKSPLAAALAEAGFGETTRTAMALTPAATGPAPAILQFDLDTVPAD